MCALEMKSMNELTEIVKQEISDARNESESFGLYLVKLLNTPSAQLVDEVNNAIDSYFRQANNNVYQAIPLKDPQGVLLLMSQPQDARKEAVQVIDYARQVANVGISGMFYNSGKEYDLSRVPADLSKVRQNLADLNDGNNLILFDAN